MNIDVRTTFNFSVNCLTIWTVLFQNSFLVIVGQSEVVGLQPLSALVDGHIPLSFTADETGTVTNQLFQDRNLHNGNLHNGTLSPSTRGPKSKTTKKSKSNKSGPKLSKTKSKTNVFRNINSTSKSSKSIESSSSKSSVLSSNKKQLSNTEPIIKSSESSSNKSSDSSGSKSQLSSTEWIKKNLPNNRSQPISEDQSNERSEPIMPGGLTDWSPFPPSIQLVGTPPFSPSSFFTPTLIPTSSPTYPPTFSPITRKNHQCKSDDSELKFAYAKNVITCKQFRNRSESREQERIISDCWTVTNIVDSTEEKFIMDICVKTCCELTLSKTSLALINSGDGASSSGSFIILASLGGVFTFLSAGILYRRRKHRQLDNNVPYNKSYDFSTTWVTGDFDESLSNVVPSTPSPKACKDGLKRRQISPVVAFHHESNPVHEYGDTFAL